MAADTRSLKRRNRWAAFLAATVMSALAATALQLAYLRAQRARQRGTLDAGAKAVEGSLASSERQLYAPLGLRWALGADQHLTRTAHSDFKELADQVAWPEESGRPSRALLSDGRSFLLMSSEPLPTLGGMRIFLALETTQDDHDERRLLYQRIGAVLLVSLASLLIADLIFRSAMNPIRELAMKAASIRPKELGQRLNLREFPVELHDLVASLNITLERMQDAFQRMEHLSTDLAHELRSPIQNLRSELEGLLLHPPGESERTEALGSALEELDRLGAMIEQMLFLARCEDPGSELRLGSLPVSSLLQEIADYFEASAENADVTLAVEAESAALFADRALVQRALGNLVSNALRHTPPGGHVTLRGRADGKRILLEVEDTGEGIPPDVLPRLGTRFTRVEDSRSRSTGGTGLGLAIVRGIMRLHGGTLEVESEVGRGTLARLSFRMDPAAGRARGGARA